MPPVSTARHPRAAALTGSSAMLSEGVHSLVDSINEVLLLYGTARAARAPDANNPFGFQQADDGLEVGSAARDALGVHLHPTKLREPLDIRIRDHSHLCTNRPAMTLTADAPGQIASRRHG